MPAPICALKQQPQQPQQQQQQSIVCALEPTRLGLNITDFKTTRRVLLTLRSLVAQRQERRTSATKTVDLSCTGGHIFSSGSPEHGYKTLASSKCLLPCPCSDLDFAVSLFVSLSLSLSLCVCVLSVSTCLV